MLDQDKILNFLRVTGPTLPSKVAKNIKSDILLASAHLSDLASQSKVKISNLKIGGSPLYFLPGQESQLYQFVAGNVNPKDMKALELLKAKKVVAERDLDLLSKVAFRSQKDFAIPLHVTVGGKKELFWKWHVLPELDTNKIIGYILYGGKPVKEEPAEEVNKLEVSKQQQLTQSVEPEVKHEEFEVKEEPEVEDKEEKPEIKPESEKDQQETLKQPEKKEKTILQKVKDKIVRKKKKPVPDEFLPIIEKYFSERSIKIEQQEMVRKNTEIDFLVIIPSVVGDVTYFCKAKNKARCDEKDVSTAYMEAQVKKLPLLFLYKKEITKKAQDMLDSGAFQNVTMKRFE